MRFKNKKRKRRNIQILGNNAGSHNPRLNTKIRSHFKSQQRFFCSLFRHHVDTKFCGIREKTIDNFFEALLENSFPSLIPGVINQSLTLRLN